MEISEQKRHSWLDSYKEFMTDSTVAEETARQYVARIDDILHAQWELGRNLVLLWSSQGNDIWLLVVPHYLLVEHDDHEWITRLVAGPKYVALNELQNAADKFGVDMRHVAAGFDPLRSLGSELVSALVRRYGVSLVHDRAVALFDAVGFSLLSPLEQVTQLNSL
ncbi:MAG: hypothetical protein R3302_05900, partial [Sulfurimonadaceae bacterium]|nr:hypothetical protein [Sulfurimonadaceae bacterium]